LWRVAFPAVLLLLSVPTSEHFFFYTVLAVLTLASAWIEAEIATRLSLQCTLLICHTLYMQYMSLYLFNGGVNCPLIGKHLVLIPLKFESHLLLPLLLSRMSLISSNLQCFSIQIILE
jgi:hypothetical protein